MHLREAALSGDRTFPPLYSIRLCQEKKKLTAQTSQLSTQNSANITQTPKAGSACGLGLQLLCREQTISPSLFPGLCLALLCTPVLAEVCPLSLQSISCGTCDGQRYLSLESEARMHLPRVQGRAVSHLQLFTAGSIKAVSRATGGKVFQLPKGEK